MFKIKNKRIIKDIKKLIILIIFFVSFVGCVDAASLFLMPSSTNVSVGNIVSLKIQVGTDGKFINNGEAILQFPVDMLEVISITKSSSIFSLWVEEPSFSNITGKISFNGGVPTPGYSGQSGYVATVTFKAKKQGTASIIFSEGAIRENDGLGTDILSIKNGSILKIEAPKIIDEPKVVVPVTPSKPSENVPKIEIEKDIPPVLVAPLDTNIIPVNNEILDEEPVSIEKSSVYSLYAIIVLILVFLLLISLFFLYLGWHKYFKLKEKINKII